MREHLDSIVKSEYIFYDVANERPYSIQEEKMENIGAGVRTKLVIRKLNIKGVCWYLGK